MLLKKNLKRGAVETLEFVITIVLLTIFLFLPFAIYSTYMNKAIIEDAKERCLHLVSIYGEVNDMVVNSIARELDYYGLVPSDSDQRIVITISNVSNGGSEDYSSTSGDSSHVVIIVTRVNDGGDVIATKTGSIPTAYKLNKDILYCEMQVPSDKFLNSVYGLIGIHMSNENQTGATLAYKSMGYRASEYVP